MHRQRRRIKRLGFFAALTVSFLVAPTSLTAGAAPERATSLWQASTALAALASISDTASNRTAIVINDFGSIWRAAGLPVPPTLHQWEAKSGYDATSQIALGSPAGSQLWPFMAAYPGPLGYPVLSLDGELDVGPPADDLSEVWGPITQSAVLHALKRVKPHNTTVGTDLVLDLGAKFEIRPAPFDSVLLATRFVAIPKGRGRLVTGARPVSWSAARALVDNAAVAHPLSRDPSVLAALGAFGPTFESLTIGTSFIIKLKDVLHNSTPEQRAEFEEAAGLSQFQVGPVIVGLAYTKGAPQAQSVVADALYPSPTDAQEAVGTVAHYAATGESIEYHEPYRQFWRVDRTTVHGSLVVMDLTTRSPGSVTRALINNDFPLFWSP